MFLGPDPKAPSRARRAIRGELGPVLEGELLERATLLVSELVTNSVRHASLRPDQEIELTVRLLPQGLRVEVAEPGGGFEPAAEPVPHRDGPGGTATGGWGLMLVDRLSTAWGVERDGLTKVWFEMAEAASG